MAEAAREKMPEREKALAVQRAGRGRATLLRGAGELKQSEAGLN